MDKITVLLPAYNEELSIGETVRTIKNLYPDFEVLVVDDGSTDRTRDEAVAAGAHVRSHPYNIGNGAAVKTGLRHAGGDWIVMMDADGQHDPADIARLLEHRDRYDMVIGARVRSSESAFHRDMANWIFNKLASYVTKFSVQD
ncbi:MAG: glycosyltransferase family 2 protein, partial [Desulfobacterales bacterium]|nr:glycosyltransferase family 2 protein [Desulfobacterales bacterium]